MKILFPLAILLSTAIASSCSDPKPAQPPKPAEQAPDERILFHSRAIMNLLGPHASDCTKADSVVQRYLGEHQKELKGLPDRYQAMLTEMTPEQKLKHQKKLRQKIGKLINERLNTMMTLGMQCPDQAKKIHKAMDFMNRPE
jgi:hypothetical protein